MTLARDRDFAALFNDPSATRVLATTDEDGTPHVVVKDSLRVDEDGRLVLLEVTEYSQTNRNLVRAIWFGRRVAVNVRTADRRSFHLTGRPVRAIVAGPVFERHYQALRARRGDVDLSTVWIIEPDSLEEKGKPAAEQADRGRIPLVHLDRLAKAAPEETP
jgi:predicted pyridoxine 5'-phosphate oxidase superfamily flavin-nucleotide-binding protein